MASSEHAIYPLLSSNFNIQTEVIYKLSETASKIALQNFEWQFITMVYFNTTFELYGAEFFFRLYEKCVIIRKGTFDPKFVETRTSQYVLFENSVTNLVHTLEWMRDHEFDNTGKYIIVCLSLVMQDCDEASAMQALWKYKITNIVLLKSTGYKATGFTYFPLNNKSCIYDDPVKLENLTLCLNAIDFDESCNFFPKKLRDFNGCPLKVSSFLQQPNMNISNGIPSGADGDLLRLIAEKLNVNLSVMTPMIGNGWGKLEPNGTWSGSLADIYYDYANFSMTAAALTRSRFSSFQLSKSYQEASVVWVTHKANKVPSSLKLAYPFQENARIVLAVSFAIVILFSLILQTKCFLRLSRKYKLERPRSNVVFYSWMICMGLGVPTTKLPSKAAFLYIVLLWMWYCILVRTFYQVYLISVMKSNYYYEELQTIDDVVKAGYPFGGGAALKDYYIDHPVVYDNWKDVETSDIIPTLRKLSKGMDFVLAMSGQTAKTIIWKEKIRVYILPQKVVSSPTVIFFKKFSPLAESVNSVLVRLTESGFSEKFYANYAPTVAQVSENAIESIKLEHYTGCYVIIMIGWSVSFLLFVAEILFNKIYRRYREYE